MSDSPPYHLFDRYGVEVEYMIVAADTLAVLPVTDRVLHHVAGEYASEIERGELSWSNELVLHVIELKTGEPASALEPLSALFQDHVRQVNDILAPLGGRLMPSAMHPWMDPATEMKLWPHDNSPVYEAFHRIFDCRGHGWANLQSVHLNLPFADDDEFGRLHAAIRLLLPIMPAIAASSPMMEGRLTGLLDNRLDVYRSNCRRIPSISGQVIPEPVYTPAEYQRDILERLYAEIAEHDPDGILQHEWLNARGAIARFDRNTIEVRVLDVQETPLADLAICKAIALVLHALTEQRWSDSRQQQAFPTDRLAAILLAAIGQADQTAITDPEYLALFGFKSAPGCTAKELWRHLLTEVGLLKDAASIWHDPLQTILTQGPLARRIVNALDSNPAPERTQKVYRRLCDCLAKGEMFT